VNVQIRIEDARVTPYALRQMAIGNTGRVRRKRGVKRLIAYGVIGLLVLFVTIITCIEEMARLLRRLFRGRGRYVLWAGSALILIGGLIAGWRLYLNTSGNHLYGIVTKSLDYPAESSIATDEYTVSDELPKVLSLPSIGAEGIVQRVGEDQNKQIATPNNVHAAGWYVTSVKPGEVGLSIMQGHLQGRYSKGIFYDLDKLKPHDRFSVTYGSGRVVNFAVVSVATVSVRDAAAALATRNPALARQLNLSTVSSAVDPGTERSNQRVIVEAVAQ
jgi:hypothetical protein